MTTTKTSEPREKNYVITEAQRNSVLQYLANRPFIEVSRHINTLGTLTEINDKIAPDFIKK